MMLLDLLVSQIGGRVDVDRRQGCHFTIRFALD